jgi:hypothetical protein
MAQAAHDYLPIPSSEVDIEHLFNIGRDILGIRHFSMNGECAEQEEPVKKHTK